LGLGLGLGYWLGYYTQNLNSKLKNFYAQTQKFLYLKPKPKNVYTQTQNLNLKIFILKPKTQKFFGYKRLLYMPNQAFFFCQIIFA